MIKEINRLDYENAKNTIPLMINLPFVTDESKHLLTAMKLDLTPRNAYETLQQAENIVKEDKNKYHQQIQNVSIFTKGYNFFGEVWNCSDKWTSVGRGIVLVTYIFKPESALMVLASTQIANLCRNCLRLSAHNHENLTQL